MRAQRLTSTTTHLRGSRNHLGNIRTDGKVHPLYLHAGVVSCNDCNAIEGRSSRCGATASRTSAGGAPRAVRSPACDALIGGARSNLREKYPLLHRRPSPAGCVTQRETRSTGQLLCFKLRVSVGRTGSEPRGRFITIWSSAAHARADRASQSCNHPGRRRLCVEPDRRGDCVKPQQKATVVVGTVSTVSTVSSQRASAHSDPDTEPQSKPSSIRCCHGNKPPVPFLSLSLSPVLSSPRYHSKRPGTETRRETAAAEPASKNMNELLFFLN